MLALVLIVLAGRVFGCVGGAAAVTPLSAQSDAVFAASYAANNVANVSATTQRVSCYAPELVYFPSLPATQGYLDGGMSPCGGAAT